jgi:hypothetical protein
LGLWLSQEIVQKHAGRISVKSRIAPSQSGTAFSFGPVADKLLYLGVKQIFLAPETNQVPLRANMVAFLFVKLGLVVAGGDRAEADGTDRVVRAVPILSMRKMSLVNKWHRDSYKGKKNPQAGRHGVWSILTACKPAMIVQAARRVEQEKHISETHWRTLIQM